jgi:hypothetical protein
VAHGVDLSADESAPEHAAVVPPAADSRSAGTQTQSGELPQALRLIERAIDDLNPFIALLDTRLDAGELDDDPDLRHDLLLLRDVVAPTITDAQTILQRAVEDGQLSERDRGELRADLRLIERLSPLLTNRISIAIISSVVHQLVLRALGG